MGNSEGIKSGKSFKLFFWGKIFKNPFNYRLQTKNYKLFLRHLNVFMGLQRQLPLRIGLDVIYNQRSN